ncbi:hypothetical protein LTR93_012214 [Exophiala xenobiotica]|nr:hypothetical protein LTR93_012214 [Exophiala xenobiotica]
MSRNLRSGGKSAEKRPSRPTTRGSSSFALPGFVSFEEYWRALEGGQIQRKDSSNVYVRAMADAHQPRRPLEYYGDRDFSKPNTQAAMQGYLFGEAEKQPCESCANAANMGRAKEPVFPERVSVTVKGVSMSSPGAQFMLTRKCTSCYLRGENCSLASDRNLMSEASTHTSQSPVSASNPSLTIRPLPWATPSAVTTSPTSHSSRKRRASREMSSGRNKGLFEPSDPKDESKGAVLVVNDPSSPRDGDVLELRVPAWRSVEDRDRLANLLFREAAALVADPNYVPPRHVV